MGRPCTICTSDPATRERVEHELVAGLTLKAVSLNTGMSVGALHRHKTEHLPKLLARACRERGPQPPAVQQFVRQEVQEGRRALDVVKQLREINTIAFAILKEARDQEDGELALKAIDRIHKQLELQGRLLGQLEEGAPISVIVNNPEWTTIRTTILVTLRPYPEALRALAAALREVGSGS